jgi:hypothetical protein
MAKNGALPKDIETCPLPVCPASLYGKAKRKPTQTKAKRSINPTMQVREPGDCVSVDVLVSTLTKFKFIVQPEQFCCGVPTLFV